MSDDTLRAAVTPVAAAHEGPAGPREWLAGLVHVTRDLRAAALPPTEWQARVHALMAAIHLPDLLACMDFERLTANLAWRERGEVSLRPAFPVLASQPGPLSFLVRVFALREGRSVAPHGHTNMASAFLVLRGTFRGRLYDRVSTGPDGMIIRPTIDRTFVAGHCATMSPDLNNVHWFQATSDTAFLLDINVAGLQPGPSARSYVDLDGERLPGGCIRAPLLERDEAYRRYG